MPHFGGHVRGYSQNPCCGQHNQSKWSPGGDDTGFGWNGAAHISAFNINGGRVSTLGKSHIWNATINLTGGELRSNGGISDTITENYFEWGNNTVNTLASANTSTISGRLRVRADVTTNMTFNVANGTAATDLLVSAAITQTNHIGGTHVGITKSGAGKMVLSAPNNYSGPTTVSGGILSLQRPTLADNAAVSLSFGAKLDLDFIGNDAVSSITLSSTTITTPGRYNASTHPLYFSGTGSLVIRGSMLDYNAWQSSHNVIGGENDDDDQDGLSNREEYAFGLHPKNNASCSPITIPLDKAHRTFSYTRRVTSKTDLVYSVWFSDNLITWTKDTGATDSIPVVAGDVETVEVTLSARAGLPLPENLFIQVRVD